MISLLGGFALVGLALTGAFLVVTATIRDGLKDVSRSLYELGDFVSRLRQDASTRKALPELPSWLRSPHVKRLRAGERWEWEWTPPVPVILRGIEITMLHGRIEAVLVGTISIQHLTVLLPTTTAYRPAALFQATHPLFPKMDGMVDATLLTYMELFAIEDVILMVTPICEYRIAVMAPAA